VERKKKKKEEGTAIAISFSLQYLPLRSPVLNDGTNYCDEKEKEKKKGPHSLSILIIFTIFASSIYLKKGTST